MILKFFKSKQTFVLFFIPLVALVLQSTSLFYPSPPSEPALPIPQYLLQWLATYPIFSSLISVVLISFQAVQLSRVAEQSRVYSENSHLVALIYVLLSGALSEVAGLSEVVIANTFAVIAFGNVLAIYNQQDIRGILFKSGLYIALASLFYLPSALLLLVMSVALFFFRTPNWKEVVIPVLGFLTPYAYVLAWYFWQDRLQEFLSQTLVGAPPIELYPFEVRDYVIILGVLMIMVLTLMNVVNNSGKRVVRVNNLYKVVGAYLILSWLSFLVTGGNLIQVIQFSSIPMAIFMTYYFYSFKPAWLAEVVVLLLIGSALFDQWYEIVAGDGQETVILYLHLLR